MDTNEAKALWKCLEYEETLKHLEIVNSELLEGLRKLILLVDTTPQDQRIFQDEDYLNAQRAIATASPPETS